MQQKMKDHPILEAIGGNEVYFLREVDVGIIAYVSDAPGFFGIHKQRFSDFVVREVAFC
jgi:hypothetical protein